MRRSAGAGSWCLPSAAGRAVTPAPCLDGFRETLNVRGLEAILRPVADTRTWLLRVGWRRHGLLSVHELTAG